MDEGVDMPRCDSVSVIRTVQRVSRSMRLDPANPAKLRVVACIFQKRLSAPRDDTVGGGGQGYVGCHMHNSLLAPLYPRRALLQTVCTRVRGGVA